MVLDPILNQVTDTNLIFKPRHIAKEFFFLSSQTTKYLMFFFDSFAKISDLSIHKIRIWPVLDLKELNVVDH